MTLIGYIKSSLDTIIEILVDEKLSEYEKQKENKPQEYETVLIKYESDIRGHIKIEHQLKLYAESLQSDIEDLEKENKRLLNKLNYYKKKGNILDDKDFEDESNYKSNKSKILNENSKDDEMNEIKLELKNNLILLKSYEEQNLKLSNVEKRLKNLLVKKEKEYLDNEKKLKEEIKILNKKIIHYEEKLKKISNLGNVSFNNSSNAIKPSSSSTAHKEENSNVYSGGRSANHSNRKNSSTSLSASSSIDKIERYLKNKILNKNSKFNHNQNIINNMKKGKIQNQSLLSKRNDEFFSKLLMNESDINSSSQKKKFHNRHRSLENNNKLLRNKHSSIFKDIINSSVNNSKLNTHRNGNNNSRKNSNNSNIRNNSKNEHIEMVNNINIYTNTLKQDNHNVYYKTNIANSSNNSNTNKNIVNHIYNNNSNNSNRNNQEKLKPVNSTNLF